MADDGILYDVIGHVPGKRHLQYRNETVTERDHKKKRAGIFQI